MKVQSDAGKTKLDFKPREKSSPIPVNAESGIG
jgi:hypothetical protein